MTIKTTSQASPVPVVGTTAYWTAQREAFDLIARWEDVSPGSLYAERDALRAIAAHGFASRVMAAHRRPVAMWLHALQDGVNQVEADCDDLHEDDEPAPDPDEPSPGHDWCPRGCQPLFGLGECGMCGFAGHGVEATVTRSVAEYCCHCKARTHQDRNGTCQLCGKDAEDFPEPTPRAGPGGSGKGLLACLASAGYWRDRAEANRTLASGSAGLSARQGDALLREADAFDEHARWWASDEMAAASRSMGSRP